MLSGDGNENSQKKNSRSNSKKKNNFARAAHFFWNISLPLFCKTTTWNFQKLPSYTFYGGNVVCGPVHFFSLPLFFSLVAAIISLFLIAAIKCHVILQTKLVSLVFFISGSSFFYVIHANVDFKIKSKERIGFVVVVFYL